MADDQSAQEFLEELGRRLESLIAVRADVAQAVRVIGQTYRRLKRQIEAATQADMSSLDDELKESVAEATRTLLRLTRKLLPEEKDLQVRFSSGRGRKTTKGKKKGTKHVRPIDQRPKKSPQFGTSIAAGTLFRACFTGESIPLSFEGALARTWADWATRKTIAGVVYPEDILHGDSSLLRRELRSALRNLQHIRDGTHPQGQVNPSPKLKKLYEDIGAATRWEEILQVMANWGVILNGHQKAA